MYIIQIYPTAEKDVADFYDEVALVIESTRIKNISLVLGDFNAKVDKDKIEVHMVGFKQIPSLNFENADCITGNLPLIIHKT